MLYNFTIKKVIEGNKMNKFINALTMLLVFGFMTSSVMSARKLVTITPEIQEKVKKALPKDFIKPKKARKVIVFSKSSGFVHSSTSIGNEVLKQLASSTGAYEVVFNDNPSEYTAEYLKQFDVIVVNNATHVEKAFKGKYKEAFINFIKDGKGFVGIHSASDGGYATWKEYSDMIGGSFKGHPWNAGGKWAMRVVDPNHPINKGFKNINFMFQDEIYIQAGPYKKGNMHTLIAIDAENDKKLKKHTRQYPISWIKKYGEGKVFYTCFGHRNETYYNATMVDHMLKGIQYALGDLEAEMILGK